MKKYKMSPFNVLFVLILCAFLGCSGGSGSSPPDDTDNSPSENTGNPENFHGAWYGRWTQSVPEGDPGYEEYESFTVFVQQNGSTISGTILVPYFIVEEEISGSVTGNTIQFRVVDGDNDLVFTATLNGSEFDGTITGPPLGHGTFQGYSITEKQLSHAGSVDPESGLGWDLAYDGEFFWSNGFGINKINSQGEAILYTGSIIGPLAYGDGSLWGTDNYGQWVVRVDETGTITDTLELDLGMAMDGLAHDGTSPRVQFGDNIYLLNTDGEVQGRHMAPGYSTNLTYGGGYYWTYCNFVNYLYQLDAQSNVISVYRNVTDVLNIDDDESINGGMAADDTYIYITNGFEIEVLEY